MSGQRKKLKSTVIKSLHLNKQKIKSKNKIHQLKANNKGTIRQPIALARETPERGASIPIKQATTKTSNPKKPEIKTTRKQRKNKTNKQRKA